MAWTAADLENLEAAIVALSTGKRVLSRESAGKTTSFQGTRLEDLLALRSEIQAELGIAPLRTYAKQGGRGA